MSKTELNVVLPRDETKFTGEQPLLLDSAGWVYVVTNPYMPGLVKIGETGLSPAERRLGLGKPTGVPAPFEEYGSVFVLDRKLCETNVFRMLQHKRVKSGKEFFEVDPIEALRAVHECAERMEIDPNFQLQVLLEAKTAQIGKNRVREYKIGSDVLNKALSAALEARNEDAAITIIRCGADPNHMDAYAKSIELGFSDLARELEKRSVAITRCAVRLFLTCPEVEDAQSSLKDYICAARDFPNLLSEVLYELCDELPRKAESKDFLLRCIALGPALNWTNPSGQTLLHKLCGLHIGEGDILNLLLDAGANPNAKDSEGKTPLLVASRSHKFEAICQLIEAGAQPWIKDRDGRDVLANYCDRVDFMGLKPSTDVESDGSEGDHASIYRKWKKPLISTALQGLVETGADTAITFLHEPTGERVSLLQALIFSSQPDVITACIDHGTDVFWCTSYKKWTAAHIAAHMNDVESLERLVNAPQVKGKGVMIERLLCEQDRDGDDALAFAKATGATKAQQFIEETLNNLRMIPRPKPSRWLTAVRCDADEDESAQTERPAC